MKKITSVCPYCGAGCKLKLVVENNKIIRAEAAEGVTNQNQLSQKAYNAAGDIGSGTLKSLIAC